MNHGQILAKPRSGQAGNLPSDQGREQVSQPRKGKYGIAEYTGTCRICGREDESTELHHIISRNQIKKSSKEDLCHLIPGIIRSGIPILQEDPPIEELREYAIHNLPGNIVEICGGCHDMTRSSDLWRRNQIKRERKELREEGKPWLRRMHFQRSPEQLQLLEEKRKDSGLFQCEGFATSTKQRCQNPVENEGDYCDTHEYQRGGQNE